MQQQSSSIHSFMELWWWDLMAHMCDEKIFLGYVIKEYIWMDEEVRMFTSLNFTEW